MKILILCFLIFSLNSFAGYMSKADMLDCEKSGRTFYLKQKLCKKSHADCVEVPKSFHCKTYSELDTSVEDLDSPKFSKNEIETCIDQADCETKNAIKSCIDVEENVLMAQNYSDIYCSKQIGYNQMTVKMIREDPVKKSVWDAAKASKATKKDARELNRVLLRGLVTSLKAGTDLTPAQNRKLQILLIRKLRE